jgi:ornithine cyclodeaminase/alanine dehydrogenase-like protein (mu-crystallin family)
MNERILYLSKKNVESLHISMKDVIDALERMFSEKGAGRVEMPPKPGIHTRPDAFIHAMPAYIPSINSAGIKWVGGYPANFKKNLPYITGLLILNDPETGLPLCVMDCTWITAMRTGAATAVAAKYLAPEASKIVAILGCGVQGESNMAALSEVLDIELLKVYDIDKKKAEEYRTRTQNLYGVRVEIKNNPEETVRDSHVVVTAGPFLKNAHPVIQLSWIRKGAFCCPLDLDSYFKPEVFSQSDVLCTDDLGQLAHFRQEGYFAQVKRNEIIDIANVIGGKTRGRSAEEQIITSINIGIALEDMAVAPLVYSKAMDTNCGTWLEI